MERDVYAVVKELLSDMGIFVAIEDDGSEWINIECVPDLLTSKRRNVRRAKHKVAEEAKQNG